MNKYKVKTAVALCVISTVAYAAAFYLECEAHPDAAERYVSYGDCLEALTRHNREYHGGVAKANCRTRRR